MKKDGSLPLAIEHPFRSRFSDPSALGSDKGNMLSAWIMLKFGERVLKIVEGCTDTDEDPKPSWSVRKEQHVARIAHEPSSTLLVSVADKLHNVRALQSDHRAVGEAISSRFNPEAGRAKSLITMAD